MAREIKNILVNTIHDHSLVSFASRYLSGSLIDIGCGIKPYKDLLEPYVTEHIGVDHKDTIHDKSNIDLFGTAYQIPVENATFDSAICTAVLEHLEEPEKSLHECFRVLKFGGIAVYSVPFIWHLHEEPRDFYRFTKYSLKYLFEKVGFEIVELKALSGFWVTFGQEFIYYLWRFRAGGKLNPIWWIIPLIGAVIQGISYLLDKIDHPESFTWMYRVVVRKNHDS